MFGGIGRKIVELLHMTHMGMEVLDKKRATLKLKPMMYPPVDAERAKSAVRREMAEVR